jgi:SSS family solute:Na+ symporter
MSKGSIMRILLISAYLIVLIIIGIYSKKKSKTIEGFFVAERRLGLLSLSFTLSATVIGSSAIIVAGIYVYRFGLSGLWLDLSGGIGLILLAFFFARKIRGMAKYTLPQIVEKMYGQKAYLISSLFVVMAEIAWLALIMQSTQAVLSTFLPLDSNVTLLLVAAIIVLYTYLGGQYAVAYSDILQFAIMIIGICFLTAPLALYYSKGFSTLSANYLSFPISSNFGVMDMLSLLFMVGLAHMVGSDIYSKLFSAQSEKISSRGAFLAGIFKILFGIAVAIIALSAIEINLQLEEPASLIPEMIFRVVPFPLDSLVIVALLATLMSSADSVLLTASAVVSNDIIRSANNKKLVKVCQIMVIVIGGGSLILALLSPGLRQTFVLGYSIFAAGLVIPILFGFYKDKLRLNSHGAIVSMIVGSTATLMGHVLHWKNPVIYGMATGIFLLFLISFLFQAKKI